MVRIKYLIAGILICSCSGCATYFARDNSRLNLFHQYGMYPATKLDIETFTLHHYELVPLALFDLPFSLTIDTILIPYDYYTGAIDPKTRQDDAD